MTFETANAKPLNPERKGRPRFPFSPGGVLLHAMRTHLRLTHAEVARRLSLDEATVKDLEAGKKLFRREEDYLLAMRMLSAPPMTEGGAP
jgi:DNA-binding transcriptional regulator YiaG